MRRAQIARALKIAKLLVSETYYCGDKEQFICHALARARNEDLCSAGETIAAEKMIMGRLGPGSYCLEDWIEARFGHKVIDDTWRTNAMQEYRHRWLDALILEFSN